MEDKPVRPERKRRGHRKLIKEEEAEIYKLICSKRPWQCGFESSYRDVKFSLWSRSFVMQLIELRYAIKLSDGGVSIHLMRWGFPSLNMKKQAKAGCTKAIQGWLDEHYGSIQERAGTEGANVFWMSKMSMGVAHQVRRDS